MSEIKVFDDVLSLKEQNKIKDIFLSNNFPWFYIKDITNAPLKRSQKRHALSHTFIERGNLNSNYFGFVEYIVKHIIKKLKFKKLIFSEVRSFLQFPLNIKSKKLDTPHVDSDMEHDVFLYYVNDNEADTIIYLDRKFKKFKKIKSKQGRLVVFPGTLWHTAEQPTKNIRCVINFNVIDEKK